MLTAAIAAPKISMDTVAMIAMLLIAGASMSFAVHQWWRGHDVMAIGLITFALVMAGVAIEAAKNNQNAEATEILRQP